jgi:hypothetical protein
MALQVETVTGRRAEDQGRPVVKTTIPVSDSHDSLWIVLVSILLLVFVAGGLLVFYFQNSLNIVRSDNQVQFERIQGQIKTIQLQITPTR